MYKAAKRVCVIGAGPSGMSALYQFKQLEMKGQEIPEIVCFDKQSDWGGLWKYSWQTGEKLVVVLSFSSCFHILITKQTTARCYWLPGRHVTSYNKTFRSPRNVYVYNPQYTRAQLFEDRLPLRGFACVQTSPISFVARGKETSA